MAFQINLTEIGAFAKALGIALPFVEPFVSALMTFDPLTILGGIVGLGGMMEQDVFRQFFGLGLQVGLFSKIANSIPFKKEYDLWGMKLRLV